MGLREIAESDLGKILEDPDYFGWDVSIIDPSGKTDSLIGFSGDIGFMIDPDTGQSISGRYAEVNLRISTLFSKGFTLPRGISDPNSRPWVITFNDLYGNAHTFKVFRSMPDRTLGFITCVLEKYGS